MLVSSDSLVALGNKAWSLLLLECDFERAKGSFRRFVVCMEAGSLLVLELFVYSHVSSPQLGPSDVALACVVGNLSKPGAHYAFMCFHVFVLNRFSALKLLPFRSASSVRFVVLFHCLADVL